MDMTNSDFPYGASIQWISPEKGRNLLPQPLMEWLTSKDSLTLKLKACCQQFDVKILAETSLMGRDSAIWTREVLLSLDGSPWIFARTLVPKALATAPDMGFISLGDRPLGELLYSNQGFIPGTIEIAQIKPCNQLLSLVKCNCHHKSDSFWGRRRYFDHKEQSLVVYEVFLPDAEQGILNLYKQKLI